METDWPEQAGRVRGLSLRRHSADQSHAWWHRTKFWSVRELVLPSKLTEPEAGMLPPEAWAEVPM